MRNKTKHIEKYLSPGVGGVDGVSTPMSASRLGLSRYISAVGRLEKRAALSQIVGAQLFCTAPKQRGNWQRIIP
jgi:hypothetical protein